MREDEPGSGSDYSAKALIIAFGSMIAVVVALLLLFVFLDGGNESRLEWVKAIGGFGTFAAAIAVVWGFRYTRETVKATGKQVQNQTEQLRLDAQARTDDLFFKACGELGSDSEPARIGALYALQHIGTTNRSTFNQVVDVVSAFMRSQSAASRAKDQSVLKVKRASADIAVAFDVLTALSSAHADMWNVRSGNLDGVDFSGLFMVDADWRLWSFQNAWFRETFMHGIDLDACDFTNAVFIGAEIYDVVFSSANFLESQWVKTSLFYNPGRQYEPFRYARNMPSELKEAVRQLDHMLLEDEEASVTINTPEDEIHWRGVNIGQYEIG